MLLKSFLRVDKLHTFFFCHLGTIKRSGQQVI